MMLLGDWAWNVWRRLCAWPGKVREQEELHLTVQRVGH
jgi:hypothetical protein